MLNLYFLAGAFFGSFIAYISAYFLGRRKSLWFFAIIFQIGAGIMLASSHGNLAPILAGRVLAGVGVGGASMIVPIYISELAPPAIRGRLVGIYEAGWQIGGLVGFWINYGISETLKPSHSQWLIPFAVQLIPGGLLLIGSFFLRESPRWLYSVGRREEGLKNLCWIRNLPPTHIYLVEEVSAMESAIQAQQSSRFGMSFSSPFKAIAASRSIQWRFILGNLLFLFQNGSGINAINYYSPTVFKSIGITGTNTSLFTTGLFGVVKTIMTFVWLFLLIDRVGRRNILLIGSAGGAVCMYIIGAYIAANGIHKVPQTSLGSGGIAAV